MIKPFDRKAFQLPYVGNEIFRRLLRLGLSYNRSTRTYSVEKYNNVEKIMDAISDILKTNVSFLQICVLCTKNFPCTTCKYVKICPTRDFPLSCICPECLNKNNFAKV
jgi:hypothetical protein